MAIAVQTNAVRYIDVDAGDVIDVSMHLDEEEHIKVLYGNASLVAERGTDYTVALQPDSFNSFQITVGASLKAKIDALIAGDADEENAITIRRTLPLQTESTPANVRYTKFTSQEFDRIIMMMQQIQEQLDRAVQQPPINVGESGESIYVFPGTPGALAQYNEAGNVVPGPIVNDVEIVASVADAIAALGPVAVQIATLADYTAELTVLGSRGAALDALALRATILDTLYLLRNELDALYDVREHIASLGPVAPAIAALDAIKAQIVAVEAIKANVTTVANNDANVTAVGQNIANVNTVAGIDAAVSTLAGMSAQLTALYNIRVQMAGVYDNIGSVIITANAQPQIAIVAGIADGVQSVADNLDLIQQAVDALPSLSTKVSKTGDTMTGPLILSASALAAGAVAGSVLTLPAGAEVVTVAGNGQIWDIHPVRPFGAKLTIISAQDRILGAGTTVGLSGANQTVAKANVAVHFVSDGTKWQLEGGATYDKTRWLDRAVTGAMPISPEMLRHAIEALPFTTYKWFDEKANRPAGTQWQNTTGKTMFVVMNHFGGVAVEHVDVLTDGGVWVHMSSVSSGTGGTATVSTVSFPVPAGGYYRRIGGPATLNWWAEFRAVD